MPPLSLADGVHIGSVVALALVSGGLALLALRRRAPLLGRLARYASACACVVGLVHVVRPDLDAALIGQGLASLLAAACAVRVAARTALETADPLVRNVLEAWTAVAFATAALTLIQAGLFLWVA